MGCYVNPRAMSKELWLRQRAKLVGGVNIPGKENHVPSYASFAKGTMPVVLIDNAHFTAAGVAYNEAEYREFTDVSDYRPRALYEVSIEKLRTVSDIDDYMKPEDRLTELNEAMKENDE